MNDDQGVPPESESARQPEPEGEGPLAAGEGARLTAAAGDGADLSPSAESDLWQGRTRWKHYSGRIALWVAGSVVIMAGLFGAGSRWTWLSTGVALSASAGLTAMLAVWLLGRPMLSILGRSYRLTSQRLFIEKGVLSKTIDQTELIRVDDVRISKSLFDRIFGLGTVAILSTDTSDREIRLEGIAEPDRVGELIRSRMRAMRGKSLFVETL